MSIHPVLGRKVSICRGKLSSFFYPFLSMDLEHLLSPRSMSAARGFHVFQSLLQVHEHQHALEIDAMALTPVGTPRSPKEPTPARYMARVRKQRVLYNAQRSKKSIVKKSNKSPVISQALLFFVLSCFLLLAQCLLDCSMFA